MVIGNGFIKALIADMPFALEGLGEYKATFFFTTMKFKAALKKGRTLFPCESGHEG